MCNGLLPLGTEPSTKSVYSLYSDYVLKNPFYELDMPIRCELFDQQLSSEVNGLKGGFDRI